MWKRAKGFFDVVAYTGDGVAGKTVSHSLGVVPEMMWIKSRDISVNWSVYHKEQKATHYDILNLNSNGFDTNIAWNNTEPTDLLFSVGTASTVNYNTGIYIAYLFATLAGVSKVFSYTGNGTSQIIDCGFSAGARFILIKRTDSSGDWYIWDSVRGIIAGNSPHLSLNTRAAQVATDDSIDPHASGFIVNQVSATNVNVNAATYIGYSIA